MLQDLFLESALKYPKHRALNIDREWWTYQELYEKALYWSQCILEVHPHAARIGFLAYRSEVSYLAPLSALLAGSCFVPLNPFFPVSRTAQMLEQAELDIIIVENKYLDKALEAVMHLKKQPKVLIAEFFFEKRDIQKQIPKKVSPTDPAYLLFTSGSTGVPKGIEVSHESVCHFIEVNQKRYQIGHSDRLTQNFDQTFDLSIFDLFMAWSFGACVCVPQSLDLIFPFKFIMQKNITVWFSVPSVGLMMKNKGLLKPNSLPTLRLSLFCGEALTAELAEHWQLAAPNSILENLYGPTELTIACAAYQWNPKTQLNICKNGIVPIGKIYSSLPFVIINQNNEIVEKGSIGELCVSGVQMFKGYLKNDFNPFLELKDKNGKAHFYYKTGDLVQETMTDGLVFLGRKDQQVKVNGYRIELGEIENAIRTLYHADTAVALAVVDLNSSLTTLIAFVGGDSNQNKEDIKKLQQILPHYMIPKEIHWVSEFPLNINGKIDRKVLLDGWKKSKNEKPKKTERECVCEC